MCKQLQCGYKRYMKHKFSFSQCRLNHFRMVNGEDLETFLKTFCAKNVPPQLNPTLILHKKVNELRHFVVQLGSLSLNYGFVQAG